MAEELVGNCLIGQSGGPTAVINASVAGVVAEALNHASIEEIYGSLNGVPPSTSKYGNSTTSSPSGRGSHSDHTIG